MSTLSDIITSVLTAIGKDDTHIDDPEINKEIQEKLKKQIQEELQKILVPILIDSLNMENEGISYLGNQAQLSKEVNKQLSPILMNILKINIQTFKQYLEKTDYYTEEQKMLEKLFLEKAGQFKNRIGFDTFRKSRDARNIGKDVTRLVSGYVLNFKRKSLRKSKRRSRKREQKSRKSKRRSRKREQKSHKSKHRSHKRERRSR